MVILFYHVNFPQDNWNMQNKAEIQFSQRIQVILEKLKCKHYSKQ